MRRIRGIGIGPYFRRMFGGFPPLFKTLGIAWWPGSFDGDELDDKSENELNATVKDVALYTNGSDNNIKFDSSVIPESGDFTVAFRFSMPNEMTTTATYGFFGTGGYAFQSGITMIHAGTDGHGYRVQVVINGDTLHYLLGDVVSAIDDGLEHEVVLTVDRSGSAKLYTDGVLKSTIDVSSTSGDLIDQYTNLEIGSFDDGRYFSETLISGFRVLDYEVQAADIANVFSVADNLLLDINGAEGNDSIVYDKTKTYNGTISGTKGGDISIANGNPVDTYFSLSENASFNNWVVGSDVWESNADGSKVCVPLDSDNNSILTDGDILTGTPTFNYNSRTDLSISAEGGESASVVGGKGILFDDTADEVDFGYKNLGKSGFVEIDAIFDFVSRSGQMIFWSGAIEDYQLWFINSAIIRNQFNAEIATFSIGSSLSSGVLHRLRIEKLDTSIKLYIDGILIGTETISVNEDFIVRYLNWTGQTMGAEVYYVNINDENVYYFNDHSICSLTGDIAITENTYVIDKYNELESTKKALAFGYAELESGERVVNMSLDSSNIEKNIYVETDGSGDFTTMTAAIASIVEGGAIRYNIYFHELLVENDIEMKDYVTIVGSSVDEAIIEGYLDPSSYTLDQIRAISTMNVRFAQKEITFKNMTITAQNCRYGVHHDSSSYNPDLDEINQYYDNVRIIHKGNTEVFPVHGTYGYDASDAVGGGFCANNNIYITDCYAESLGVENFYNRGIAIHGQTVGTEVASRAVIKDTICKSVDDTKFALSVESGNIGDVYEFDNVELSDGGFTNRVIAPFTDNTTVVDNILNGEIEKT